MAWTELHTFTTTELMTAALLNVQWRDNMAYLKGLLDGSTGHGHSGAADDGPQLELSALPDGLFTADAAGRAKFALGFITAAMLEAGITIGNADTLDGMHAADIASGGIPTGFVMAWPFAVNVSNQPVNPWSGAVLTDFVTCYGQEVAGVTLPDYRDRAIVGVGTETSLGTAYGNTTRDISHAHNIHLAAQGYLPPHMHDKGTLAVGLYEEYFLVIADGSGAHLADAPHNHELTGVVGSPTDYPALDVAVDGPTISGGATALDMRQKCRGAHWVMKVA
jgi:hypothetical protein